MKPKKPTKQTIAILTWLTEASESIWGFLNEVGDRDGWDTIHTRHTHKRSEWCTINSCIVLAMKPLGRVVHCAAPYEDQEDTLATFKAAVALIEEYR